MKVLITGTGLIAHHLEAKLKDTALVFLSTSKKEFHKHPCYYWNIDQHTIDDEALRDVTHIIHVAGAGVADKRWTRKRKKELIDSRVVSAELLFEAAKRVDAPLQAFISASGVGFYGAVTNEHYYAEEDTAGTDFLAQICIEWEAAADHFKDLGARVVKLRTGVVLAADHSGLQRLVQPVRKGIGAVLGNGKQYFPWIHIDDITGIYLFALQNDQLEGVYNASGPNSTTNKDVTYAIAKALGKRIIAPNVPAAAIRLVFGELAISILQGSRVSVDKIIAAGYQFQHTDLEESLASLLKKEQNSQ